VIVLVRSNRELQCLFCLGIEKMHMMEVKGDLDLFVVFDRAGTYHLASKVGVANGKPEIGIFSQDLNHIDNTSLFPLAGNLVTLLGDKDVAWTHS